jgi:hypothetical protein
MTATAQKNGAVAVPTPAAPKMTLASVQKGKREQPTRVVLFGVEGIGKSTFGANAPKPIFIGAEDGTGQLDIERFPSPESWGEIIEAIRTLTNEKHDYQTLVIDTLDWAEPLLWAHICKRDGQKDVESYGFGKGYVAALDEWRVFLAALERMRKARPMHVVLIAHSWIKSFKSPDTEDFDRYEMKLHAKAGGLIKEWADAVLFANWETYAKKDERTKRVKGISTGARLIYTERTAAYDAKNRYGLPESLPLSWEEFEQAMKTGATADPAALLSEIKRKAGQFGGDVEKNTLAAIDRAGGDAAKLAQLNNWLNGKLAQKEG